MRPARINPERLQRFTLAYAPSVLRAVHELKSWTGDLSPEEYAVAMTEGMVAAVQRAGVPGIEHYYLNTQGGALRYTCAELGIEVSTVALEDFIGGRI